ncbi:anaphase-promoting complex subunit 5 [Anthonomus grandis grandis]|uniref:anaphase-promoting complex subunit 5 n=1 Tax=Anthonomus grandis grandis TaxID=2921223 RepID=UPI002166775E|nr:anaphase-promoting complex subunit 5 [Anthonomus grandis grandis]
MSTGTTKDNPAPSKTFQRETVTPYKLAVAVMIKCYCEFKDSDEMEALTPTEKVNLRRAFCIQSLNILQGPDLILTNLRHLLQSDMALHPICENFDLNLKYIYQNGIGSLMDIIDDLRQVLNGDPNQTDKNPLAPNSVIVRNSVVGYFLRRFIVFFEKLSISEVSALYEAYLRYYTEWKKMQESTITIDPKYYEWFVDENQWSRRQAELFLATQAALLQNDEEKALQPQDLHTRITSILKSNPDLAEAHFMSFLNYLRVEEFCGAMRSLFHCFDRRSNPELKCYNDEKNKEHRYAALNLAILYHHFGHINEALASLKEAIKIAHQANDNLCLQHALSWLYRLSNVNKDNLIVQCIIKTFELNISYTTSLALQNFAHYGSSKTCVKPSVIFETLTKSDMLNCQHNYKDLIFNNNAMKASLWRLYGKTDMCSLWSQVLLYLNIDTETQTSAHYGEGYLQAICNVAMDMLLQGEYNLVNVLLQYAKRRYPNEPLARTWMLVENWASYTRALYHEKWQEAESAAQKILVLDKWEGYLKLAELNFYQQEYDEANNCLAFILQNYNYDEHLNDGKFCLLRAKILQAEIQFASSYPNVSGPLLNNCLLDAEKSELAYQIALVQLHMANTLLTLGLTTQAVKVLNNPRCMVEILSNGGEFDKARATLLYIKCIIADSSKKDPEARAEVIRKASISLEKVKMGFSKVEAYSRVKDVLYLQAQLYNILNMKQERNDCSLEYRILDEEHPTKNIQTLIKFL